MTILSQEPPLTKQIRKAIDPAPPSPLESALVRVAWLLKRLGYVGPDRSAIVAHIRELGTAECCPFLRDSERPHIEALLPSSPAWADPEWDEVWSTAR